MFTTSTTMTLFGKAHLRFLLSVAGQFYLKYQIKSTDKTFFKNKKDNRGSGGGGVNVKMWTMN